MVGARKWEPLDARKPLIGWLHPADMVHVHLSTDQGQQLLEDEKKVSHALCGGLSSAGPNGGVHRWM